VIWDGGVQELFTGGSGSPVAGPRCGWRSARGSWSSRHAREAFRVGYDFHDESDIAVELPAPIAASPRIGVFAATGRPLYVRARRPAAQAPPARSMAGRRAQIRPRGHVARQASISPARPGETVHSRLDSPSGRDYRRGMKLFSQDAKVDALRRAPYSRVSRASSSFSSRGGARISRFRPARCSVRRARSARSSS
jgi:hypothetical protein